MEAKNLRIGNLIEYRITDNLDDRKEWWEVSEIDSDDLGWLSNNGNKDDNYRPIPLTVEILLRLGFEMKEEMYIFENLHYKSTLFFYDIWHLSFRDKKSYCVSNLKGYWDLHELQNLYYALTKQELTLKP